MVSLWETRNALKPTFSSFQDASGQLMKGHAPVQALCDARRKGACNGGTLSTPRNRRIRGVLGRSDALLARIWYAIQTRTRTGSGRLQAEHGSARSNGRGNACVQTHEKACPGASICDGSRKEMCRGGILDAPRSQCTRGDWRGVQRRRLCRHRHVAQTQARTTSGGRLRSIYKKAILTQAMRRTQEGERPRQYVVHAAKPAHPRRLARGAEASFVQTQTRAQANIRGASRHLA